VIAIRLLDGWAVLGTDVGWRCEVETSAGGGAAGNAETSGGVGASSVVPAMKPESLRAEFAIPVVGDCFDSVAVGVAVGGGVCTLALLSASSRASRSISGSAFATAAFHCTTLVAEPAGSSRSIFA